MGLRSRKNKDSQIGRRLVTLSKTKSIYAEQFRTIRTNIRFSIMDGQVKTILVTSSSAGEGKSTNVANLAVVYAQEGKKVLIVDADMRKPSIHSIFGIDNVDGLSTVLSMQGEVAEAIQETPIVGLSILPSGPVPPNPMELLSSAMFHKLVKLLRDEYDIVLFDAPPIMAVADAQMLANECDGTLLIVMSGVAHKENVLKAKNLLLNSKAKILGAVLNRCSLSKKELLYYG